MAEEYEENDEPGDCEEFEAAARKATVLLLEAVLKSEETNNSEEVMDLLGNTSVLLHNWGLMLSLTRLFHTKGCYSSQKMVDNCLNLVAHIWREGTHFGHKIAEYSDHDRESLTNFYKSLLEANSNRKLEDFLKNTENVTIKDLLGDNE